MHLYLVPQKVPGIGETKRSPRVNDRMKHRIIDTARAYHLGTRLNNAYNVRAD
jgi:hypothetical protein